ncbi:MAG: hypothetical protein IPN29_21900 [Saprospiraceae bacterium]|nr:hypothetical protein [Saprospiraceae bacterium]
MNTKHLFILGFCLLISLPHISAQQLGRVKTEAEINTEEKFTNAQRELLTGRIDKALTLFEELYREDRENATLAFELAKAYYQKKDLILTEKYAKIATEKDPGNKWMAEFYGVFLLDCGRPGAALAVYQKLNSQHPLESAYYQNLVDCHLLLEKTQGAINVYNQMEKTWDPMPRFTSAALNCTKREEKLLWP